MKSKKICVTVILLMTVSGCGSPDDYTIPTGICDRFIDPNSLKPLLPSGKNFEASQRSAEKEDSRCVISIDKSVTLYINEYRDQKKFDVMSFAESRNRFIHLEKSKTGDDTVIADGKLLSMNACPRRGAKSYYILDITLTDSKSSKEQRENLDRFAASYLPTGLKAMEC
ncbi:hypothetical protein [Streptomyces sp. NBC_01429]|uniref:hypothetical protein n=1 Tax=Streptomyces sp. NBC_01429 TaxID=2903862 RepID=UPI002E282739|nr:hypothetical protein [Streptomyces sp. NBC_01429]